MYITAFRKAQKQAPDTSQHAIQGDTDCVRKGLWTLHVRSSKESQNVHNVYKPSCTSGTYGCVDNL